jgi:hypothetical protein
MPQDKTVKASPPKRLATALIGAGIPLATQADLRLRSRAVDHAVLTFAAREVSAKSSPAKKAEWTLCIDRHVAARAEALNAADAATRCAHEEQIARLSSEEPRDIPAAK